MDESRSRPRERRLIPEQAEHSESRIQYVLNAEAKILQAISARAPVPAILNEVCCALDCQMGNMVSLISLPEDETTSVAEIARSAALFGLYIFFSAGIFAESGEELGSLEMYCCNRRNPSRHEIHLIERAACLAAIAIERDEKTAPQADGGIPMRCPSRRNVPGWPASMN
ncbi:MAG: hypothetical protein WBH24_05110 [Candidatus Acidiferrum sp.]|jgi:hypothetical protein